MMDTVRKHQRNAIDYGFCYENLCALQNLCPLPAVTANLDEHTIDCNADRVRQPDWAPILTALKINKTLKCVAFRSFWQQTLYPDTELSEQKLLALKKKTPPIRSKDMTYKLCRIIKDCLSKTESLNCLILQGIPLRERDLACLAKGITKNSTIQHLSLEFCQIGDHGLEILSNAIKGSQSITSINFTGCNLTWRGAEEIAKIIRFQATRRHSVAWQDSLRYRRPDMDRMTGLRRISLCKNPLVSDRGMSYLAEALKDDLWVKALDLQQCGVSTEGAMEFQPVLKFNTTITVLDLRLNPLIDRDVLTAIMEQIMMNAGDIETEFPWIVIEEPKPGRIRQLRKGVKRERPRTVSTAYNRRSAKDGTQQPRSRSASVRSPVVRATVKKTGAGVPWRTAARVGKNRHKLKTTSDDSLPRGNVKKKKAQGVADFVVDPRAASSPVESEEESSFPSSSRSTDSDVRMSGGKLKEMKIEIEFLRRRVEDESRARASADSRVLELQVENRRLQQEIRLIQARQSSNAQKSPKAPATTEISPSANGSKTDSKGRTLLEDDRFLESIEASFRQFYAFLDMLKGHGYGDLVQMLKDNGFPVQPQPTATTSSAGTTLS